MIHVEYFACVQAQGFDDVVECVRVYGFFKCLAQEVLPGFGVCDVFEDGEYDVVADEAFARAEEPEVSQDDFSLGFVQRI